MLRVQASGRRLGRDCREDTGKGKGREGKGSDVYFTRECFLRMAVGFDFWFFCLG